MTEVEDFTHVLTDIGRSAATLKTSFPSLQGRLKSVMSAEMEKVVREEKFLKEEPERIDSALRRCKKLTNTMVTMKKLAMVQDHAIPEPAGSPVHSPSHRGAVGVPPQIQRPLLIQNKLPGKPPVSGGPPIPPPPKGYQSPDVVEKPLPGEKQSPPQKPPPPPPQMKASQGQVAGPGGNVLDSLLEELQTVAKGTEVVNAQGDNKAGFSAQMKQPQPTPRKRELEADKNVEESPFSSEVGQKEPVLNGPTASHKIHSPVLPEIQENPDTDIPPPIPPAPAPGYQPPGEFEMIDELNLNNSRSRRGYTPPSKTEQRSRSGTPTSVSSEPIGFGLKKPPPAPPPRSSSRSTQILNTPTGPIHGYTETELAELKHQLGVGPVMNGRTPGAPIVQTNALAEDEHSRFLKSASSSESVNSQEGLHQAPGKMPPPPPPPRNRQEMLEQRHQELLSRQKNLQSQYHQLQQQIGPNGNGNLYSAGLQQ